MVFPNSARCAEFLDNLLAIRVRPLSLSTSRTSRTQNPQNTMTRAIPVTLVLLVVGVALALSPARLSSVAYARNRAYYADDIATLCDAYARELARLDEEASQIVAAYNAAADGNATRDGA